MLLARRAAVRGGLGRGRCRRQGGCRRLVGLRSGRGGGGIVDRRLGRAARARVAERCSWERVTTATLDAYRPLEAERPALPPPRRVRVAG
jgi:hypothetical protein